jgi:hypothetical protein
VQRQLKLLVIYLDVRRGNTEGRNEQNFSQYSAFHSNSTKNINFLFFSLQAATLLVRLSLPINIY